MAKGWTDEDAVQDQIDSTVEDALQRARRNLPKGESLEECEACGAEIPQGRREALPGVRLCVDCQSKRDSHEPSAALYNRRASKDSQLR